VTIAWNEIVDSRHDEDILIYRMNEINYESNFYKYLSIIIVTMFKLPDMEINKIKVLCYK